jgi:hypothetical protein
VELKWRLEVVPNVGHDLQRISTAAAAFLYSAEGDAPIQ